jgi:hypothetical protein
MCSGSPITGMAVFMRAARLARQRPAGGRWHAKWTEGPAACVGVADQSLGLASTV